MFFQDTIQALLKCFDENNKVSLSEEEKIILERKSEKLLCEGVKFWKESAAYSKNGQIIFSKNITSQDMLPEFLGDFVELLQIPGYFSYDFHGTMRHEKNLIFTFSSQNSCLRVDNERNFLLLDDSNTLKVLSKQFRATSYDDYLDEWYLAHDLISDLTASGIKPERLLTLVVYFEPINVKVAELFGVA